MRRAVVLLSLAGILTAQTPTPEWKGAIHGVVKDTDGAPVAGVEVHSASGGVVTDDSGTYELTGLASGAYLVTVVRDRLTIGSRQIQLDDGQTATLDFVIPGNPEIHGKVVNQNDEPEVDAFVWLLKPEYQNGVLKQASIGPKVTNEDGTFAFDKGLEPNRRYLMLVDRPPPDEIVPALAADLKDREPIEAPTYYPSATRLDAATPIVLAPGEKREQVEIKIATSPYYCVAGKIVVSGKPASSMFGIFESALAGSDRARVRSSSDEDGAYHVCGLTPGSYRLSVDEGFADFSIGSADLDRVDVSADLAHLDLKITWDVEPPKEDVQLDDLGRDFLLKLASKMGLDSPTGSELKALALRVINRAPSDDEVNTGMAALRDDGLGPSVAMRALAGVANTQFPGATVAVGPDYTGGRIPYSGAFKNDFPAGDYPVDVPLPPDSYVKEMSFNGVALSDGLLSVTPGATGTLHVLLSRGTAALKVNVADSDGKPVPDATVLVVPESATTAAALSRLTQRGQTDQTGTFEPPPLAPGKYRVLAIARALRWNVPEEIEKVVLALYQAKEVDLSSKDTQHVTVAAIPL